MTRGQGDTWARGHGEIAKILVERLASWPEEVGVAPANAPGRVEDPSSTAYLDSADQGVVDPTYPRPCPCPYLPLPACPRAPMPPYFPIFFTKVSCGACLLVFQPPGSAV